MTINKICLLAQDHATPPHQRDKNRHNADANYLRRFQLAATKTLFFSHRSRPASAIVFATGDHTKPITRRFPVTISTEAPRPADSKARRYSTVSCTCDSLIRAGNMSLRISSATAPGETWTTTPPTWRVCPPKQFGNARLRVFSSKHELMVLPVAIREIATGSDPERLPSRERPSLQR